MAGAVDLAAVKARSDAAARAAEAPPVSAGTFVSEVDENSFQPQVMDRSMQVPVLLDFYADQLPESAALSATLAKLCREANGAWLLARIDVQANPQIAQALRVAGVPTVFAVIGGQLVPGFQGPLPEAEVRRFLDAVLQAGQEAGLTGVAVVEGDEPAPDEPPADPRFTAAEDALADGDFDLAVQRYQAILQAEPANAEAMLALRQVELMHRLDNLDQGLVARADAEPTNVEAGLAAADQSVNVQDMDGALARLLALIKAVGPDDKERVRTRLIEYFDILGPDDPRVAPARRELARALF